ncbi:MAG: 50S ribosomal protein L21 [Spirochaetota bacterium]|nr:50S ribosomal protein L21 [Spirochaetota bacterium]
MYAIVEIAGKQYKVEKDMTIAVDKLKGEEGDVTLDKVLMCVDGEKVLIGQPYLDNVSVSASVLEIFKDKKVRGIKFKKRKNYTRTLGHRQQQTKLKINDVAVK